MICVIASELWSLALYTYDENAFAEQKVLKYSIVATIMLAIAGVVTGIVTGSSSIIFDGMYSSIDCLFSLAALLVVRLIHIDVNRRKRKAPKFMERFQFGFWHLEPMLLAINGLALLIAVFYALSEAFSTILNGGHTPNLGYAAWFTLFAVILCFGMAIYEYQKNKKIGSAFITIDVKSWIVSGAISFALLCTFIFAHFVQNTSYQWLLPFFDPVALAFIAICMFPMPVKTVAKALRDVLMITPEALDDHVNSIVDSIVEKYNFVGSQNYVACVGRSTMIEIHLILPENYQIGCVETLDKIRSEIGDMIGEASPDRWLTVSFTAEPKWVY